MFDILYEPWPWYIAGPLIGLIVPVLLITGNKMFGISSSFRHLCAACLPTKISFFRYDWKEEGGWNLTFVTGVVLGGFLAGYWFENPEPVAISGATVAALAEIGITSFDGLVPADLFNWQTLLTPSGLIVMVVGGFLVGFGTRYASGCTSGHGITGLANLQVASLIAVIGFFIGGLITTYVLLPLIL
ncbi:MAG: YeeE/YedE thiosulfate transporter family protein [Balneolaceae bacterium]